MFHKFDLNDDVTTLKALEDLTTNAKQIQEDVLREILNRNAKTEYLKKYINGLEADEDNFKKQVPSVIYEDVKPYIDRVASGEPSEIISSQPITIFLSSSGTSGGQPKLFPLTAEEFDRRTVFLCLPKAIVNNHIDGLNGGKTMSFCFVESETKTPAGLPDIPFLTSYYKSNNFKNLPSNWYNDNTSPYEAIVCLDHKQSMYCQLLCALVRHIEIVRIATVYASAFLRVIKFLEDHWKELCSSIRTSHISDWITDRGCRFAVSSLLERPNPELADLVESLCVSRSWEGIIQKLWPRTTYLEVILTGSMSQYVPMIEFYTGGGLPLVSPLYASSECNFGLNLEPLSKPSDVSYTVIPNMAYYEFLPVERNGGENIDAEKEEDRLVDLVDVEMGQCYQPVVTTYTGLYRLKLDDILMVTGFHNRTPKFRFIQRKNIALSIDVDKTKEEDLLKAVTRAKLLLEQLSLILVDYTSFADTSSVPGHYVLFWEIKSKSGSDPPELDPSTMEECCFLVEDRLDFIYKECRGHNSIGALEIRVLKNGTFDALMDLFVSRGASVSQYKTPRCIKSAEALKLLDSRVAARYFSQKAPLY